VRPEAVLSVLVETHSSLDMICRVVNKSEQGIISHNNSVLDHEIGSPGSKKCAHRTSHSNKYSLC
jgi:hypothetical protein